jgi:hypothetical protein
MAGPLLILATALVFARFMGGWSEAREDSRRAKRDRKDEERRRAREPNWKEQVPIMQEQRLWYDAETRKLLDEDEDFGMEYLGTVDLLAFREHWDRVDYYELEKLCNELHRRLCERRLEQGLKPLPRSYENVPSQLFIDNMREWYCK